MIQHAPLQKLTDAVNANMQTYLSFAEIVLNTSERLSSLNIDATRSSFKQFSAYARRARARASPSRSRPASASRDTTSNRPWPTCATSARYMSRRRTISPTWAAGASPNSARNFRP